MQKTTLALFVSSLFFGNLSFAEETTESTEPTETLETIVVSDQSFSQQIGTQKITAEQIAKMPTTNGNITDLLKSNPNVSFSQTSNRSNLAGEIRPDDVSFHGEKYYSNNFIIDGMSNNDNINPRIETSNPRSSANTQAYSSPSGGTQSMWIDSSLVKSVEVFDSNISAKYGEFTGGVVNAELKDPDFKNSGKIFYRTTRDTWASFFIDDSKRETFEKSTALDQQSQFKKQIYGFNLNQKISDKASVLLSYSKTVSDIQFYHSQLKEMDKAGNVVRENISEPQRRTNETLLLKGIYLPDNGDVWRLTAIYSPHKSKATRANFMSGGYEASGGGEQFTIDWEKQFDSVKMKSYLGYKHVRDEVENDETDYNRYVYITGVDYPNWKQANGYALWGGYGTFYNEKTTYTAKQDFTFTEFDWLGLSHKLIAGWSADYAKAKYVRKTDSSNYLWMSGNVNCAGDALCIDGQQYAYDQQYYNKRNIEANDSRLAMYVEDSMEWKRLQATLGLRANWSKALGNANLAPRFSASYDVFGDGSSRIFGGVSRYYSDSLLYRQLSTGRSRFEKYKRSLVHGQLTAWELTNDDSSNAVRSLNNKTKTPYSDEIVLGLSQDMFDTNWTFKWVNRKNRDGLTSVRRNVDGTVYEAFANYGSSDSDTFTIAVSPKSPYKFEYAHINWQLGASRTLLKSNYKDYLGSVSDNTERAVYNGRLLENGEVPPSDFNSPWQLAFSLDTYFPQWNLTWSQFAKFTQGREYLDPEDTQIDCSASYRRALCGSYTGLATEYKNKRTGSEFSLDWRFTYKQPTLKDQFVEVTLDINNVLNRKSLASSADGTTYYKMGRNFWLGVSYNW